MFKPQIWDLAFSKPTVCVVISHHFLWADNGDIIHQYISHLICKNNGSAPPVICYMAICQVTMFSRYQRRRVPEDHQSSVTEPSLGCLKRPLQLLLSKHPEAAWNWNRHLWIDMTSTQHCIKHCIIYIYIYYIIIMDFVGICIASLYVGDIVSASHSQGLRIHALFDLVKAPCVSSGNICCNHWFLFDDGWTLPATTMGSCLYTKTMKKCIYMYMLCTLYIYVHKTIHYTCYVSETFMA